jgi:hypothetical protein
MENISEEFKKIEENIKGDISKFSIPEMFNDTNGKTSPLTTLAFIAGLAGCLVFILTGIILLIQSIMKNSGQSLSGELTTAMTQSGLLIAGSLSSLTAHRFTKDQPLQERK